MFNNEVLEQIYKDSQSMIHRRRESIDKVSNDIRSLEELFKKSSLKHDVRYFCNNGILYWDTQKKRIYFNDGYINKPLIEFCADTRLKIEEYLSKLYLDAIRHISDKGGTIENL